LREALQNLDLSRFEAEGLRDLLEASRAGSDESRVPFSGFSPAVSSPMGRRAVSSLEVSRFEISRQFGHVSRGEEDADLLMIPEGLVISRQFGHVPRDNGDSSTEGTLIPEGLQVSRQFGHVSPDTGDAGSSTESTLIPRGVEASSIPEGLSPAVLALEVSRLRAEVWREKEEAVRAREAMSAMKEELKQVCIIYI